MRTEFKLVKMNQTDYAYPIPVIKGKKYLIELPAGFTEFFLLSWINQFLPSPDEHPDYLKQSGTHSDGRTPIFSIEINQLHFSYLSSGANDLEKSQTIERVLSKKIHAILRGQEHAHDKLQRTVSNQMACTSCQSLGIARPEVCSWLESLGLELN